MTQLYHLTETEISILKLIASGYTALEAGEKICGNANTGRTHADHIRAKMNVLTIEGASTLAQKFGYFHYSELEVRLKDPSKLPMCDYPNSSI